MDLKQALARSGGAARSGALLILGVSAAELTAAQGGPLQIGRGAFALPEAPPGLAAAVRLNGVASHSTAAELHGFPLWRPSPVLHVTVAGNRPPEAGVHIHRARLEPEHVDAMQPMTAPLRTLVDCGRVLPLLEALVIMDAAVHRGRVRLDVLQAAADAARGHGSAALRRVVSYVDRLAESPLESVLRLIVSILNCTVRSQARVPGVGKVDFVVNGWLALEGDGFEFHSDRRAYRDDRRRGTALVVGRYVYLRFSYEDLAGRPGWVFATIAHVLAAGPPWAQGKRAS
jgi:very-short-patch-repair endonuclease